MKIIFAEISQNENKECTDLLKYVSPLKRIILDRYRYNIDRKLSLYADVLVRKQAMYALGIRNKEIEYVTNKHGKPYIDGYPEFQFNISHTRNAIAVAFSNHEIGIDIEKIDRTHNQLLSHLYTPYEQKYILSHKDPNRAFYEIWTKKEAYVKYIGIGLALPLNSFDVFEIEHSKLIHTYKKKKYIIACCCKETMGEKNSFMVLTETEILYSDY